MHGRLKVKTTAAQAEAKRKEREEKKDKYQAATKAMMNMRKSKLFDQAALDITTKLLQVNPDSCIFWNYRREIINNFQCEDTDGFEQLLTKELSVTEMCLMNNHKSYGTWHHRGWVLQKLAKPSWADELDTCDRYLKLDARNFHCWDHRRVVVALSNHSFEKELQFTQSLIDANLSNYSAWHYRSQLLPVVHPPAEMTSLPIDEKIFLKELKNVVSAVFTDPSDQSPWFFLRWLLREKHNKSRLAQVGGFIMDSKYHLALVMSHSTSLIQLKDVLQVEDFDLDDFQPFDEDGYIWIVPLSDSPELSVNIRHNGSTTSYVIVSNNQLCPPSYLRNVSELKVDDVSWRALRDIRDNCLLLEEIDPDNKWVLLTLVDFLKVIDLDAHLNDITGYLDKLQEIDPLRKNYYIDAKNKLIMESAIRSYMTRTDGCFSLKDKDIVNIHTPHLLAFATNVNLSGNSLVACEWTQFLLSVKNLNLDGNPISNLESLCGLKNLTTLSVYNCKRDAVLKVKSFFDLCPGVVIKCENNLEL